MDRSANFSRCDFLFAPSASNNIRSVAQLFTFAAWAFSGRSCLPLSPLEEDETAPTSPPRDALARTRPVGEPGVARAIGQAFERGVAAETEILGARGADRPAASLLAQLEQRAAVFVVDRLVVGRRLRLGVQRQKHLTVEPWQRSRAASLRGSLLGRAVCIAAFFARQVEAGEFADDGVAAHPDVARYFAAGQPGFEAAFQGVHPH